MADRALLIGINKYNGCPLNGCVNDITDMADFLVKKCNFNKSDIRLLADERATTAEMWTRLEWLVNTSTSGDRVLFHYSGHGAQVATRDTAQEVDGLSEVICPVDFDWSPSHMITDKQFHALFARMPKDVKFCWISDSCHSGDLTRDFIPANRRLKCYPVPVDIKWRNSIANDKGHKTRSVNQNDVLDVGFISGCKSNQTSADAVINGKPNGALTYYLLQALNNHLNDSVKTIVDEVNVSLAANGYDQQPQAEGTRITKQFLG